MAEKNKLTDLIEKCLEYKYVFEDTSNVEIFKLNFFEFLNNSNKQNLLLGKTRKSSEMLEEMFKEMLECYPDKLLWLLNNLFDENIPLDSRASDFTEEINILERKMYWSWPITSYTATFFLAIKKPNLYGEYLCITN